MEEPVFDANRLKKKKKVVKTKEIIKEKENEQADKAQIYSYDEMLKMLYAKCSHLQSLPKDKIPMPDVFYENRKTYVKNFREICFTIDRKTDHVIHFFKAELLTSDKRIGMSEKGVLWFDGRFDLKQVLTVFKSYSREFVTCNTCGGKKTKLIKENCTTVIICKKEECQGKRSTITLK